MYKSILLALDGSACAQAAMRELDQLADGATRVHVVAVVENAAVLFPVNYGANIDLASIQESMLRAADEVLEKARDTLDRMGISCATHRLDLRDTGGSVAQAIIGAAESHHADLILLGTHGRRGMRRLLMGSVAEEVLRLATRPVLLVRAQSATEPDGSQAQGQKQAFSDWPEEELMGS